MGNLENAMKMPFFSRKKRMFVTMMIGISRSDRSVRLKGNQESVVHAWLQQKHSRRKMVEAKFRGRYLLYDFQLFQLTGVVCNVK